MSNPSPSFHSSVGVLKTLEHSLNIDLISKVGQIPYQNIMNFLGTLRIIFIMK
jgi:hypothetical protein